MCIKAGYFGSPPFFLTTQKLKIELVCATKFKKICSTDRRLVLVLLVPQREIDTNKSLVQNPGYN